MAGEVRDNSKCCPTCGRYLTVLGCTVERCARPPEEAWITGEIPGDTDGDWTTMDGRRLQVAVTNDSPGRFDGPPPLPAVPAPPQAWMACERPGCHHDITTDHEDGSGRCERAGCACEAALTRVSTVLAAARGRRTWSDEKTSPGPWRWASEGEDDQVLLAADGERILAVDKMNWNRADAALIASAPTLRDQRDRAVALLRKLLDDSELDERVPFDEREIRAFLAEVDKSG